MMMIPSSVARSMLTISLVLAVFLPQAPAQRARTDQFTYQYTAKTKPNKQFPPNQWKKVRCGSLEKCAGWPEKFLAAPDWKLEDNDCLWCPATGNTCGKHHNSPINLERNRAVNSSGFHNQCIDTHRMTYFDSSCSFDELIRLDAFTIERHALQIKQPIEPSARGGYRNACSDKKGKHFFGKIDYSKGFSDWWWLSHTDIHVPSEHTQNGKRYDAEMQLYHFYSVNASVAGVPNQMGTVTIFLEAYNGAKDYDVLNKLICQWRRAEEETREECGMASVTSSYPGCATYNRKAGTGRDLRKDEPAQSVRDVLVEQLESGLDGPSMYIPPTMMDTNKVEEFGVERADYEISRQQGAGAVRHLEAYENVPYHNYFGMMDVNTEYYFRYSGTQTIPPCYGEFLRDAKGKLNRANTNHWRIMKDPIRISNRQLNEMHRLLKNRVAPSSDPIRRCRPDTAARTYRDKSNWVNVTRPLQSTTKAHYMTFCECRWKSQFAADQKWCSDKNQQNRLFNHPYNFPQQGF